MHESHDPCAAPCRVLVRPGQRRPSMHATWASGVVELMRTVETTDSRVRPNAPALELLWSVH